MLSGTHRGLVPTQSCPRQNLLLQEVALRMCLHPRHHWARAPQSSCPWYCMDLFGLALPAARWRFWRATLKSWQHWPWCQMHWLWVPWRHMGEPAAPIAKPAPSGRQVPMGNGVWVPGLVCPGPNAPRAPALARRLLRVAQASHRAALCPLRAKYSEVPWLRVQCSGCSAWGALGCGVAHRRRG